VRLSIFHFEPKICLPKIRLPTSTVGDGYWGKFTFTFTFTFTVTFGYQISFSSTRIANINIYNVSLLKTEEK
jgi:hypothetical protein